MDQRICETALALAAPGLLLGLSLEPSAREPFIDHSGKPLIFFQPEYLDDQSEPSDQTCIACRDPQSRRIAAAQIHHSNSHYSELYPETYRLRPVLRNAHSESKSL